MLRELNQIIKLALPIILTQVGQLTLGLVDTFVIGKVGADELAGVGAGSNLFATGMVIGLGCLLGMDPLCSQAYGAKQYKTCHQYLTQGFLLALFISIPITLITFLAGNYYHLIGPSENLLLHLYPYINTVTWGMPAVLLFFALQRYWQSVGSVIPITLITIFANIINYCVDVALVWGKLGPWDFPQMGSQGVAIATLSARYFIFIATLIYTLWKLRKQISLKLSSLKPNWNLQKNLVKIGLPAGTQYGLEVGAFSIVTLLASKLATSSMAAHQIALSITSFTFMLPLGVSSAASVRVGNLIGANKKQKAITSGWLCIFLSTVIMSFSAVILFIFPSQILTTFTSNTMVITTGIGVLFWGALYQVVDGIQVTTSGALRGIGETKGPLIANLIGHYPLGLFIGIILCFNKGYGIKGLWCGTTLGLFSVSMLVLFLWKKRTKKINKL